MENLLSGAGGSIRKYRKSIREDRRSRNARVRTECVSFFVNSYSGEGRGERGLRPF